ncbi:MAG: hypothetical protein ACK5JH_16890 [Anaerocolumna sp.]
MLKDEQLKDSTLKDDAAIYTKREEKSEKQKLGEMTLKEKWQYLKTYYLAKTVISLLAISFVIYLGYSIFAPKSETILYGAIINYALTSEKAEEVQTAFTEHLELDPEISNILLDSTFYLGDGDDIDQLTMTSQQKLSTFLFAGDIDIIIGPESFISSYASSGYLSKLTDVLPTDVTNDLKDSMYYSTTTEDPAKSAYGVYIDGSDIYEGTLTERPVLAVLANSSYQENAVEFIRYIFDLE